MVTRIELEGRIEQTKKNISGKRIQIRGAKKRTDFRGVRIQDQFDVGRSGIKPFRARKKLERKQGFFDLGIFNTDMIGLQSTLSVREQDLVDFDLGGGL